MWVVGTRSTPQAVAMDIYTNFKLKNLKWNIQMSRYQCPFQSSKVGREKGAQVPTSTFKYLNWAFQGWNIELIQPWRFQIPIFDLWTHMCICITLAWNFKCFQDPASWLEHFLELYPAFEPSPRWSPSMIQRWNIQTWTLGPLNWCLEISALINCQYCACYIDRE